MAQTDLKYELVRNDNNTFAVRGNSGGSSVTVDSALSTTSENPVQNKIITAAINDLQDEVDTVMVAHTYTSSTTYTTSDSNYTQLLADLQANRDLFISPYVFKQSQYSTASGVTTYVYTCVTSTSVQIMTVTYTSTTSVIVTSSIVTLPLVNTIDATSDTSLLPTSNNTTGVMMFVIANSSDVTTEYTGYTYMLI